MVFFALFVFLLSLIRGFFAHYLFSTFTITLVLRTICPLLLLLGWCVAHHLFSTFANALMFCALFVFYFKYYVVVCAQFFFYFHFYVGVLRTICFLLSLLLWCFAHYLFSTLSITWVFCALIVFYFHFYVGVLRTICFLLSLFDVLRIRWCFAH